MSSPLKPLGSLTPGSQSPFWERLRDEFEGTTRWVPSARVSAGGKWFMHGVDPGPDNVFEVVRAGYTEVTGGNQVAVMPTNVVQYRKDGSDDEVTTRPEDEFLANFSPLGTEFTDLGKMTVTASRSGDGFPWWLLAALGAVLLLS